MIPSALTVFALWRPPQTGGEWAMLAASYVLGSIPFGLVVVRLVKGIDLRTVGSGNIGATNAMRALGKPLGIFVFFLDCAKGWVPPFLLAPWAVGEGPDLLAFQVAGGALAVVGHVFPVWLRFRGGKGVATAAGALIAIDPIVFLLGGVGWLLTLLSTRFVSASSIVMGLGFCAAAWWRSTPADRSLVVGTALLAALILVRHRSNIQRILAGTEPKVGRGKEGAPS